MHTSRPASGRSRRSSSATCRARTGIRAGGRGATCTATSGSSSQQAWFAGEVARRFGDHPAVAGWLVSNEMPLYGGGGTTDEIVAWAQARRPGRACSRRHAADLARRRRVGGRDDRYRQRLLAPRARAARRLRRAARLPDGGRPGAAAPDRRVRVRARGRASGFRSCSRSSGSAPTSPRAERGRRLLPAGPAHDAARRGTAGGSPGTTATTTTSATRTRTATTSSSSTSASPTATAGRSRSSSSWPGSRGSSPIWRRTAGSRFAARSGCSSPSTSSASFRSRRPSTGTTSGRRSSRGTSPRARPTSRLRSARELDGIPGDARLVLAPSAKLLTTGGLERLHELAHLGTTVYLSFFAGSTPSQRGPWLTGLDELFGVTHRLRYGLADPIEDEVVTFDFVEPLGDLEAGTRLSFAVAGSESARSYLPVDPAGASRGRDRLPRPPGDPPPRARSGIDRPLHLPARVHGGEEGARQPREHLAALLGARLRSGRARGRSGSTTRGSSSVACAAARPSVPCSSTARATRSRPEPILESGVELAEAAPTIGPYEVSILPLERATPARPRIRGRRRPIGGN